MSFNISQLKKGNAFLRVENVNIPEIDIGWVVQYKRKIPAKIIITSFCEEYKNIRVLFFNGKQYESCYLPPDFKVSLLKKDYKKSKFLKKYNSFLMNDLFFALNMMITLQSVLIQKFL